MTVEGVRPFIPLLLSAPFLVSIAILQEFPEIDKGSTSRLADSVVVSYVVMFRLRLRAKFQLRLSPYLGPPDRTRELLLKGANKSLSGSIKQSILVLC